MPDLPQEGRRGEAGQPGPEAGRPEEPASAGATAAAKAGGRLPRAGAHYGHDLLRLGRVAATVAGRVEQLGARAVVHVARLRVRAGGREPAPVGRRRLQRLDDRPRSRAHRRRCRSLRSGRCRIRVPAVVARGRVPRLVPGPLRVPPFTGLVWVPTRTVKTHEHYIRAEVIRLKREAKGNSLGLANGCHLGCGVRR